MKPGMLQASVMQPDWKYHLHWQPNMPSRDELLTIIAAVTPEMVHRTFAAYSGICETVAATVLSTVTSRPE
ncbi:hypothetical protein [Mycobacterium xenopi]|uniref:Uncharacterized protein n=1 Tax=Mycobacterium xenopi TaxID=1789 RepID=A0AAD1GYN4_MYCXE|nr:hypothetical protein [Mycobacterium xenopi]MDA3641883.1 hypothetical protein [Mycobacterium xenopi]MDA3658747.1 hypothetical protein [Mycobacterium xenopi]MDA3664156.1 hypothetical protein [Mycobacterium xenopi]SPX78842.1 Uncharacterised protein [Mycobacterium xenopi]BBU21266.1 hypothetical protein MYXE_10550 [Mycobacterium xenopi]